MLLLCVLFNIALIQLDVLKCQMWCKTEKSIICQNAKVRTFLAQNFTKVIQALGLDKIKLKILCCAKDGYTSVQFLVDFLFTIVNVITS